MTLSPESQPAAPSLLVRDADPEDWPSIWPIIRAVVSTGETYTYPPDLDEDEAKRVWMVTPPGRTVVAIDDAGTLVGAAKIGPNQAGPGAHVANASFMVDPDARTRGVGRALGNEALQWARSKGFRAMQFNAVVETNAPAVALWKSLGFSIVGTVPGAFAHPRNGLVGLHVMHRFL